MTAESRVAASIVLFVYGSLKRGQENHHALAGAGFIASASTAKAYALCQIAGYPALVPGERAIQGELYRLPTQALGALDELEGEAYERREIELSDGTVAIAYLARAVEAGVPLTASEWPPQPSRGAAR